ncbi:hypothetical protein SLS62_001187 [Diatrype stigma]|uniref:MYND-type domain-containing protein n=1 Tax=Diatrype stigma TaxID=117547 RepID=A0AAN9UWB7_9PEZI
MSSVPPGNEQPPACCAKCKKTSVKLTPCERCDVLYCSRSCEVAHWKKHKKTCARNRDGKRPSTTAPAPLASTPTSPPDPAPTPAPEPERVTSASSSGPGRRPSAPRALEEPNTMPFTRLDRGTYLHDRPEGDTYRLLLDAYRLRLQDAHMYEGVVLDPDSSIYASAQNDPLPGFRRFLARARARPGILPPWWSAEKEGACERLGMMRAREGDSDSAGAGAGHWASLRRRVQKAEIAAHYGDPQFPMQLRMLGEAIYGRGVAGSDGTRMRQMMVGQEAGRGYVAVVDLSG